MANGLYRQDLNRGLPTNFSIVNGRLGLVGGEPKAEDNIVMLLSFMPWFRFTLPDYVADVLWAYQRNTSVVNRYKNLLRLRLLRAMDRYCPFVEVKSVDTPLNPSDRRGLILDVYFRYRLDPQSQFQAVRFLN